MATVAEVQAELGTFGKSPRILKTAEAATLRQNYVMGGVSHRFVDWVTTTIADSAATQAAAIRAGLIRG